MLYTTAPSSTEASSLQSASDRNCGFIDALPGDGLGSQLAQIAAAPADRRTFLKAVTLPCLAACAAACVHNWLALPLEAASVAEDDSHFRVEARFYERLPGKNVQCKLCPRGCVVGDRERGHCRVRENRGGTYYTLVHSRVCAAHIDPIEKKPFFHFHPGVLAFSIATAGCNVNCKFCQNWEISQARPEELPAMYLPPATVAASAKRNQCPAVAFTYSEPTVFNEFVTDTADAARAHGLKSVVVSNGFIQQEPLKKLIQHVDAIKVDLKSFSPNYYRDVVNGELQPVLDTLVTIRKQGRWTEIVWCRLSTTATRNFAISRAGSIPTWDPRFPYTSRGSILCTC